MGGFVFKALESGFEQDVRKAIVIEREKLMNEMFRFVEAKLNSSANITDIARMVKEKTEDSLTKYSDFITNKRQRTDGMGSKAWMRRMGWVSSGRLQVLCSMLSPL